MLVKGLEVVWEAYISKVSLRSHNLSSVSYKSCCHPPPTFLFISLLVWLNLESEPNNEAPTPKKNPTAADQNPAEEPGGKHE